jgi:hypothetical protein
MRSLGVLVFALAGVTFGQSLIEVGAAAAGGAAGGAAGKKVSEGISTIFGQVDKQAKEASKDKSLKQEKPAEASAPATSLAPGSPVAATAAPEGTGTLPPAVLRGVTKPRTSRVEAAHADPGAVPAPPPAPGRKVSAVVAKAQPPAPALAIDFQLPILPAPPPPPEATAADLKTLAVGTPREDLLKLGAPASRITMTDSGHLLEIYHYTSRGGTFGVVRLNDGSVSSVELR